MRASVHRLARAWLIAMAAALSLAPLGPRAHADGGPANALVIIDPTDADSLYLGHRYVERRHVPPSNVLYMRPAADDYASWAAFQRHAVTGTLAARGLAHVDHIVIAPGRRFFIPMATNLVATGCGVVSRMSLSSAYTFLPEADEILEGKLSDQDLNRFNAEWRKPADAVAFSSRTRWYGGKPATSGGARRYFVGTLLGYLGERGNTVDEIAAMIDRSAAADGTRPDGTFYFMTTPDSIRSYRHTDFPTVIKAITDLGGHAEALDGVLPLGRHDALGILTGITHPAVVGADVTLRPGSFADHLTSFAATYDDGSQEKMSSWITAGASGTLGTVEEPCTGGKFPDAALHAFYFAGLPLGEAIWRSVQWSAFQSLVVGDPLTRPFAHVPEVGLVGAPSTAWSDIVPITAIATTTAPGATIAAFAMYVDGIPAGTSTDGTFLLDTTALTEGSHDLQVAATDSTPVRAIGTTSWSFSVTNPWMGSWLAKTTRLMVGDRTRGVRVEVAPGDLLAGGGGEVRVLQESRIVAAARVSGATGGVTFTLPVSLLGAGRSLLSVVVAADNGATGRSMLYVNDPAPYDPAGPPPPDAPPAAPNAYGYTLDARPGRPVLLDLPGSAPDGGAVTVAVTSPPAQADLRTNGGMTLLWPRPNAAGTDSLGFSVTNAAGAVATAVVTLRYCPAGAPDVPVPPGLPDPCRRWTPPPTPTPGPSPTATPTPTATLPAGQRAYLPVAWRR